MSIGMDERLSDELESLQAILMDEVDVKTDGFGGAVVEIAVLPSTAADSSSQYVRVTLVAQLPAGYPDVPPVVTIRNPRGLDESVVKTIEIEIKKKIDCLSGEPAVFELIEVVRDHLTESNLPSCSCVICLYGFDHSDQFIKTSCYHYFHSHCLWRHIMASERIHHEEQDKLPAWQRTNNSFQRICPVCRECITVDMNELSNAAPPVERETARNFELNDEMKTLQQKMAALFQHQQSRGGIIDPDAEDSKLVLVTEPTVESPGPSERETRRPPVESVDARRGGARGRGAQPRGAFAASRKNRGQLFSTSR